MSFDEMPHMSSAAGHRPLTPAAPVDEDWSLRDSHLHCAHSELKLEIGPGERPRPGYIHLDPRPLPHIELLGTMTDIPLPNDCCDEVFSAHVIEHVPDDMLWKAFREMRRVLKPGGRLLLRGPDALKLYEQFEHDHQSADMLDRLLGGDQDYPDNFHYSWHSEERAVELAREAGFIAIQPLDQSSDGWEAWEGFPPGTWAATDFLVEAKRPATVRPSITLSGWPHPGSLIRINARLLAHFEDIGFEVSYHCGRKIPGAPEVLDSEPVLASASERPAHGDVWVNHWGAFPAIPRELTLAIAACDSTLMNPEYVQAVNRHCQAIAVPSTFSGEVLHDSGVDVPIDLIPNGVDLDVFRPDGEASDLGGGDRFVFFSHSYVQPKKGFDILLEAYVREFSRSDPVVLVVKDAGLDPGQVRLLVATAYAIRPDPPKIKVVSDLVPDDEIASMLRGSDCFVWASRIEGFGLPPLEALACGTPVIAPDFGGYLDFLDDTCAFLCPIAGMERTSRGHGAFPFHDPRGQWCIPDKHALQERIRHVFEHPDEARAKAATGPDVAAQYDWARIMRAYEEWVEFRLARGRDGTFDWVHAAASAEPACQGAHEIGAEGPRNEVLVR